MARNRKNILAWINGVRETTGGRELRKIPRGARGSHAACPLAKGTRLVIDGCLTRELIGGGFLDDRRWIGLIRSGVAEVGESTDPDHRLEVPPFIAKFIEDFDGGKFPELALLDGVPE